MNATLTIHDNGHSAEMIKSLFEVGTTPAPEGEPWNLAEAPRLVQIDKAKMVWKQTVSTRVGKDMVALAQAGYLRFNKLGHMTEFKADRQWRRDCHVVPPRNDNL